MELQPANGSRVNEQGLGVRPFIWVELGEATTTTPISTSQIPAELGIELFTEAIIVERSIIEERDVESIISEEISNIEEQQIVGNLAKILIEIHDISILLAAEELPIHEKDVKNGSNLSDELRTELTNGSWSPEDTTGHDSNDVIKFAEEIVKSKLKSPSAAILCLISTSAYCYGLAINGGYIPVISSSVQANR
jgi:hypothetical protein